MWVRSANSLIESPSASLSFSSTNTCAGEAEAFLCVAIEETENVDDPPQRVQNEPDVGCRCMGAHIYGGIIGASAAIWNGRLPIANFLLGGLAHYGLRATMIGEGYPLLE